MLRINKASQQRIVAIPTPLIPELEPLMGQTYLLKGGKPILVSGLRQLESFVKEKVFGLISPSLAGTVHSKTDRNGRFVRNCKNRIKNSPDLRKIVMDIKLKRF